MGTSGRGEHDGLKSREETFGLGVHAMIGVSNSDTNSPDGVMMMDGVSGRTEPSSDKRESPEPFLSPGVNTSSQIFPSTQLALSHRGGKTITRPSARLFPIHKCLKPQHKINIILPG